MELLPQTKVKEEKKSSREDEIFRKLSRSRINDKKTVEVMDAERLKIQKEFESFHMRIMRRRSELMGEIKALEEKRDTIMRPYYELKFEAEEALKRAIEYEEKVKVAARIVSEERKKNNDLLKLV